ncbi:MAG: dTDP-4-dehydrorhamnose reductase [Terriglobia bacterium]
MKIAVTGAAGLFGHALVSAFSEKHDVRALTHAEADITRAAEIAAVLSAIRPDVVVHAAAIPDPDVCETDPARAFAVNVHGTRNVVLAAQNAGAQVAYISTDAVFDGRKNSPYRETDATNPGTVYGRTKLRSEEIVRAVRESWIFRVSVLFGPGKQNFVSKGLERLKAGGTYTVATDQLGNATYTIDAARKIEEALEAQRYGLYHVANSGCCTRLDLARSAAELAGLGARRILGKTLDEMARPARRLAYSVMSCDALEQAGFTPLRSWKDALREYISSLSR